MIEYVKGSRDGFSNSSSREAYSNMKRLHIEYCEDMEHLAWIENNGIQQSQPPTSFSRLTSLHLFSCDRLKSLFSTGVGKRLVQLEDLYIAICNKLEVVLRKESGTDGDIIKFPKLKRIRLCHVPSLRRFYGGIRDENSSSTSTVDKHDASPAGFESLFDGKVEFPALEYLGIRELRKSEIWEKNGDKNISFARLKHLEIWSSHHLEFAIPLNMLTQLQKLEVLEICSCDGMRSDVERSSSNECLVPLVALRSIKFFSMPKLRKTGLNSGINLYPNLQTLTIQECHSLRNVLLPSIAKQLLHLKVLNVSDCNGMVEIIGEGEEINEFAEAQLSTRQQLDPAPQVSIPESEELESSPDATISLLKLESIRLEGLRNLKSFSRSTSYAFNMPALKSVTLHNCGQMENFTCLEINTPLIPNFNTQFQRYLEQSRKESNNIVVGTSSASPEYVRKVLFRPKGIRVIISSEENHAQA